MGPKKIRFVGFSADKAKQLEQHLHNKEPVILTDCCVKQARYGNQLEILVSDRTDISTSDIAFEVTDLDMSQSEESKLITLNQLQNLSSYQKIITSAKVIEIDEIITLEDGRKVQYLIQLEDSLGR